LKQFTNRNSLITTYDYDPLDRLQFVGYNTVPGPVYDSTIRYTYDKADRLLQAVDTIAGTITRSYNDQTRTMTETTPNGSITYVTDEVGRQKTKTVAGQPVVSYTFDDANRLKQITQTSAVVQLDYDNANRRTSLTLPNGIVMTYGYDDASQLTGITYKLGAATLGDLSYVYDLGGRRARVLGSYARTTLPNPLASATYDPANRLTQWDTLSFSYDANGNLLNDGSNQYDWDARNQLVSVNSGAASFRYDALGRRVGKTIDLTTTNYLYDGANIVQELVGATPTANLLTGGIDEVFARTDAAGARYFLTDALGSTIGLTDSAGAFQTTYTYEPFGNTRITGTSRELLTYGSAEKNK